MCTSDAYYAGWLQVLAHANAVSGGISKAHAYMRFALPALRRPPKPW